MWDLPTGRKAWEIAAPRHANNFLAVAPDSNILITGGRTRYGDGTSELCLCETATGGLLRTIGKDDWFYNYTISPDSRLLATTDSEKNCVRVWSVWSGKQLAAFDGHAARVCCLAFSPDGNLLASGSLDTTILLWDVSKLDGRPPAKALSKEELAALWPELIGSAESAFKAVGALSGAGDPAVAFLMGKLKPTPHLDAAQIQRWIADLDSERFPVRDAARRQLAALGQGAEPLLRKALEKQGATLEFRRSVQTLIDEVTLLPSRKQARELRAVWALDQIDTPASREALAQLAKGEPTAWQTRAARAALDRHQRMTALRKAAQPADR